MPLKLIPPDPKRSPYYRVRGTLHGVYLDRSCQTTDQREARALLRGWTRQILSGAISGRAELTFLEAANAYASAGGDDGKLPVGDINQAVVDRAALELYPDASPATRNRQVYTPISAILRHVHISTPIKRPKGAQGVQRTRFLTIEEFDRLEEATRQHNPELAAFFTLLAYTGLRLSEGLGLKWADVDLGRATALCGRTKNGDPRVVHLPPRAVAALSGLSKDRPRLFRWSRCGILYLTARDAYESAGVETGGAPFHILRHSYGAWLARLGVDLVATGAWKSHTAARGYQHFVVSEEAAKADLLPGARRTK
jgi:integrase